MHYVLRAAAGSPLRFPFLIYFNTSRIGNSALPVNEERQSDVLDKQSVNWLWAMFLSITNPCLPQSTFLPSSLTVTSPQDRR